MTISESARFAWRPFCVLYEAYAGKRKGVYRRAWKCRPDRWRGGIISRTSGILRESDLVSCPVVMGAPAAINCAGLITG